MSAACFYIRREKCGLDNQSVNVLEDVLVVLDITDVSGQSANHLFGIPAPTLTGILDVAGTGDVYPASKATAQWDILASAEAVTGIHPVKYRIGGMLSYAQAGAFVNIDLVPVTVDVYPSPTLVLEYYLQREVYGDNPFMPTKIESPEPFSLGLIVRNTGFGVAKDLSFTSNDPSIIDNESGLLIGMKILAAELNGEPTESSYYVDVGDLGPGEHTVLRWLLESSLQGEFLDVQATLQHENATGDVDVSFVDEDISATHLLEHVVLVEAPTAGDGLPDFLIIDESLPFVMDVSTDDPLPNQIRLSEGGALPVASRRDHAFQPVDESVLVTKSPTPIDTTGQVVVSIDSTGWQHIRFDSPGGGAFELVQVVRMSPSGARLSIEVTAPGDVGNAWTTSRSEAPTGSSIPSITQRLTNILDWCDEVGEYVYMLTYSEAPVAALTADVDVISVFNGGQQTLSLDFGAALAGKSYIFLGSTSTGSTPLAIITVPLAVDSYFEFLFANAAALGLMGTLDGMGRASVTLTLPPGLAPFVLLGTTLHHAAVVYQPGASPLGVSNSVPMFFVP